MIRFRRGASPVSEGSGSSGAGRISRSVWYPSARKVLSLFCTLLAVESVALGLDFFASASGSPWGNGSISSPWDLQTALNQQGVVQPGDTIWLRGGTYSGSFTSQLNGTASSPIKVRQYPGERAILDGGVSTVDALYVAGSYTWYWGFEVMSSSPYRVSAQTGSAPTDLLRGGGIATVQSSATGAGLKFINLVVHDLSSGFGLWVEALDAEVSGCLIYYNGWNAPDRGHGHGIYVQNLTASKRMTDNIIFSNFSHGIHGYGSSLASLNNFDIERNSVFTNGMAGDYQRNILVGGGSIAQSPRVSDNVLFYPQVSGTAGQNLNVGYDPYGAGASNPIVTGNTIIFGDTHFSLNDTSPTISGNFFLTNLFNLSPSLFPSNVYAGARPTSNQVIVRPNAYESGRGHIVIVNWSGSATVSVDLSTVLAVGAIYEIRNAQNFFGPPVAQGTYSGGAVAVPAGALPPALPVSWASPPPSGPLFNAYVVLTTGSSVVSTPTPTPTSVTTAVTTPTPSRTPTSAVAYTQTPTPTPTRTPTGAVTSAQTPTPPRTPTPATTATSTPAISPTPTWTPTPHRPQGSVGKANGPRATPRVVNH